MREKPGSPSSLEAGTWETIRVRIAQAVTPRYDVRSLLGYGGMAGVYLAEETRLGRNVAIKVMAPALMADPAFVARFEQEARVIAQLAHPNIVTIFDIDRRADLYYFVMEHVPGPTLRQIMAQRDGEPLPVPIVLHLIAQVASALSYAHGAGVVHRDVKPANIMLDSQGDARVADFGIAKVADDAGLTRTGILVGTPSYMSPEQCGSRPVTGASDQYVLGVVAYELLVGHPPFSGPTLEVMQAHLNEPPPKLAELRPDLPEEVRSGVERMLSKRPEDRYPSVAAAAAAIGAQVVPGGHAERDTLADLTRSRVAGPGVERVGTGPPTGQDHTPTESSGEVAEAEPRDSESLSREAGPPPDEGGTTGTTSDEVEVTWDTRPPVRGWLVLAGILIGVGAVVAAVLGDGGEPTPPAAQHGEIRIAGGLPADAQVAVTDGDSALRFEDGVIRVLPGLYTLEATAPGHDTARAELNVEAGMAAAWSPILAPVLGRQGIIRIGGPLPPEAQVTIRDGDDVRPFEDGPMRLSPGKYMLEAMAPDHDTVRVELQVHPGVRLTWSPVLAPPTPSAPPPRAAAPRRPAPPTGEIRIGGTLPPDVEVTIYDGETSHVLEGGTTELPPGSYSLEATAPEHDTAYTFLTLESDEVAEWTPALTPLRDLIEAEIRRVIGGFVQALERRDVDAVIQRYPAAASWAQEWRVFMEAERDVRELRIELEPVSSLDIQDETAHAAFSLAVDYLDVNGRPQATMVDFQATFRRSESGWSLTELGQDRQ